MPEHITPALAATAFALVTVLAAGCAGTPTPDVTVSVPPLAPAPPFSGPRADEFTLAWNDSSDRWVHRVLSDETVSDEEISEGIERMSSCLALYGAVVARRSTAEYEIEWPTGKPPSDGGLSEEDECRIESGMLWVAPLRTDFDQ